MRLTATVILIAGLLASNQAQAAELAPTGDWQIRQDDEYCELSREFGSGRQAVTMFVYSYGPAGLRRVSLVGDQLPQDNNAAALVDARFDGADSEWPVAGIVSRRGERGMITFQPWQPNRGYSFLKGRWPVTLAAAVEMPAEAQSLTVDVARMEPATLQIGDMSRPLTRLADCELKLAEAWGFDLEPEGEIAERVSISNPQVLGEKIAYPNVRRVNRTSTILQVRMRITAEGEVEDCVVQAPSWGDDFKQDTCRAIDRFGEFEPARNPAGEAVPSLMRFSYVMVIFD